MIAMATKPAYTMEQLVDKAYTVIFLMTTLLLLLGCQLLDILRKRVRLH